MTWFKVTLMYNAGFLKEFPVETNTVEEACAAAIDLVNDQPKDWTPMEFVSGIFVDEVEVDGEPVPVPRRFTEAAMMVPEATLMREGLEAIVRIALGSPADPAESLRLILAIAQTSLDDVAAFVDVEPGSAAH